MCVSKVFLLKYDLMWDGPAYRRKETQKRQDPRPHNIGMGFALLYIYRMKVSTVTVATVHVHQLKTFASHNRKLRIQSYNLPDYKLFIEHWGYENTKDKKYIETKNFKETIYKEQGFKIAGTTSEDIKDIKTAIDKIFFENNIKVGN